jgi:hypothetical protein
MPTIRHVVINPRINQLHLRTGKSSTSSHVWILIIPPAAG